MSLWNPKQWVKARLPRCGPPLIPLYTVTKKHEEYEERAFPPTYWCTTLLHGLEHAKPIAFRRLMDYTSGYNARGERFHFSAPIVWTLSPRGEPVSVSIYIGLGPKALQGTNASRWPPPRPNHGSVMVEQWPPMKAYVSRFLDESNACWWPAPEPSDPELFIETWPAMIAYARMFRGSATVRDWRRETVTMLKHLPRAYGYASYRLHCEYDDIAISPTTKRNEIWLLAIS